MSTLKAVLPSKSFTQLNEQDAASFVQEAQTLARLSHPHIVRVLDLAVQDGTPFLVIEYAPHGTLRNRHAKGTRLPPEMIVLYVQQVAPARQALGKDISLFASTSTTG